MTSVAKNFKIPISVLVVIHTPDLQVLLLERADHPGFWQSVTGSQDEGETLRQTAAGSGGRNRPGCRGIRVYQLEHAP